MFELIKEKKIDALIVSNLINVRYLSWYVWLFAFLIFTKNKKYLITDSRYFEREKNRISREKKWFIVLNVSEKKWESVLVKKKVIWIESDHFTLEKFKIWKAKFKKSKFKKLKGICFDKRIIKSKEEILSMKKAADIASKSLEIVLPLIRKWISEIDIAWALEKNARELWAWELAFYTIVSFWENSSYPHYEVGDRKLKIWDVILIDFWVKYNGYCSDMSRTFFTRADKDKQEMYNKVLMSQKLALDILRPWVKISDLYKASNDYFKEKKLEKYFLHSLWHWLWLEIHENPWVWPNCNDLLKEWMMITIEPWLYFNWKYWIRIEDTVLITKSWYENLSSFSKEIVVLDI